MMEGLRKNNPSRGTDTAKHRGRHLPTSLLGSVFTRNTAVPQTSQGLVRTPASSFPRALGWWVGLPYPLSQSRPHIPLRDAFGSDTLESSPEKVKEHLGLSSR